MELDERLERARQFHGHLGPCLILGLRIGEAIVRELGGRRYFGLSVVAKCPPQPPPSCVLDGLQLSTGCTMGKRNISLEPGEPPIVVRAQVEETGQSVAFQARPEALERALAKMKSEGEVAASLWFYGLSDEEMFRRLE